MLGFLDQVFPEIRMGNGDEKFSSLPGGFALELYRAVLGYDEVRTHSRRGYDGAFLEYWSDERLYVSTLGCLGGRRAKEAVATF